MMFSERRKVIRRQAVREMVRTLEQFQARRKEDLSREERHMRRRAIRHTCKVHIALRIHENWGRSDEWRLSEHPVKGRLLDLSEEGCSLFCKQQLDIGQKLNLIVVLRDGSNIRATGVVRWNKEVKEHDGYAAGVQFSGIEDGDRRRIHAFLKELEKSIGL